MKKISIKKIVKQKKELKSELKTILQEYGKLLMSSENSQTRSILLQRIKDINEQLKKIETLFHKIGKFNTELFTEFMAQFISLNEKECVKCAFYKKRDKDGYVPTRIVLCSPETKEFLREEIRSEQQLDQLFEKKHPDIIKFNGSVIYPFRNSLNMKDKYSTHPGLEPAIYEIMQLRVDHPNFDEELLYTIVLQNTTIRKMKQEQEKGSKI